jgi:hypothetical protein
MVEFDGIWGVSGCRAKDGQDREASVTTPSRGGRMSLSSYRLNPQVAVTDMARASDFYERKLGLSAARTGAD